MPRGRREFNPPPVRGKRLTLKTKGQIIDVTRKVRGVDAEYFMLIASNDRRILDLGKSAPAQEVDIEITAVFGPGAELILEDVEEPRDVKDELFGKEKV